MGARGLKEAHLQKETYNSLAHINAKLSPLSTVSSKITKDHQVFECVELQTVQMFSF